MSPHARRAVHPTAALTLLTLFAVLGAAFTFGASPANATSATETRIAYAVGHLLNTERHANRVPTVTMNAHLVRSAHAHNLQMARSDTLSHQLRSESALVRRISAAGYHASWYGENIGEVGGYAQSSVLSIEQAMYHEHAPYDGHRQNILNGHYRNVGIDVYFDRAHHRTWLTVDFGRA